MSGYKQATVTISQEEYRRLQNADVKRRLSEYSRVSTKQPGQNEVVLNLISQLEDRERQLQAALGTVEQNDSETDNSFLQEILNQNTNYYENLIASLNNTNLEFHNSLDQVTNTFYTAIQNEREMFNRHLECVLIEQNEYQTSELVKAEAAQQWFKGCMAIIELIETQFDHERFAPGKLTQAWRSLNMAEANLANGFFEASLPAFQQLYIELSDLNFELEHLTFQWQAFFDETYSAVKDIIFQMVSNGKVKAVGLNGEELAHFVDLSSWTDGRFPQLLEHTRQLAGYMIQDQNILTLDDISRIYNQILPAIRQSFDSLVFEARINALNSQLRMNIAEKAVLALENHGYSLDESGYEDNDMTSQFNAHLACPDGSEVTINVLPNSTNPEDLSSDLVVITTHPYLKSEHEDRLQWEELRNVLGQYNLKVSRTIESPSRPITDTDHNNQVIQPLQKYIQFER